MHKPLPEYLIDRDFTGPEFVMNHGATHILLLEAEEQIRQMYPHKAVNYGNLYMVFQPRVAVFYFDVEATFNCSDIGTWVILCDQTVGFENIVNCSNCAQALRLHCFELENWLVRSLNSDLIPFPSQIYSRYPIMELERNPTNLEDIKNSINNIKRNILGKYRDILSRY